jgi:hypothetical protein
VRGIPLCWVNSPNLGWMRISKALEKLQLCARLRTPNSSPTPLPRWGEGYRNLSTVSKAKAFRHFSVSLLPSVDLDENTTRLYGERRTTRINSMKASLEAVTYPG